MVKTVLAGTSVLPGVEALEGTEGDGMKRKARAGLGKALCIRTSSQSPQGAGGVCLCELGEQQMTCRCWKAGGGGLQHHLMPAFPSKCLGLTGGAQGENGCRVSGGWVGSGLYWRSRVSEPKPLTLSPLCRMFPSPGLHGHHSAGPCWGREVRVLC